MIFMKNMFSYVEIVLWNFFFSNLKNEISSDKIFGKQNILLGKDAFLHCLITLKCFLNCGRSKVENEC